MKKPGDKVMWEGNEYEVRKHNPGAGNFTGKILIAGKNVAARFVNEDELTDVKEEKADKKETSNLSGHGVATAKTSEASGEMQDASEKISEDSDAPETEDSEMTNPEDEGKGTEMEDKEEETISSEDVGSVEEVIGEPLKEEKKKSPKKRGRPAKK